MKTITATEGKFLTQKNIENESDRLFVTSITGKNISQEDWKEALQEEKEAWEASNSIDLFNFS